MEQWTHKPMVLGSNPSLATSFFFSKDIKQRWLWDYPKGYLRSLRDLEKYQPRQFNVLSKVTKTVISQGSGFAPSGVQVP